jgi:hypothetical protein
MTEGLPYNQEVLYKLYGLHVKVYVQIHASRSLTNGNAQKPLAQVFHIKY